MQNKSFRFLKIFVIFLILMAPFAAFAQVAKAEQKIEWHADRNAFYYRIEVMNVATGKTTFIKTEKNSTTISLEPGKYRYRVYVYDFLDREAGVNEWTDFDVFKANPPVVRKLDQKVTLPAGADEFTLRAEFLQISEKSTVSLVNQGTGRETAGRFAELKNTGGNETGSATAAIFPYVRTGNFRIKITNPSGHTTLSEPFAIIDAETAAKQKADEEARLNSMKVPIINKYPEKVILPDTGNTFTVKADISNIMEKTKISLVNTDNGLEMPGKLNFSSKTGEVTASGADFHRIKEGKWHLKVTNPNGNYVESPEFDVIDRVAERLRKAEEAEQLAQEKEEEKDAKQAEKEAKKQVPVGARERGHHEIGLFIKDYIPLQRMANHADNFLGAGLMYNFYFNTKSRYNLGLSFHLDAETVMANLDYVEEWYTFNGFGGVLLNVLLSNYFSIQPQIGGGVQLDYVRTQEMDIEPVKMEGFTQIPDIVTVNRVYFSPKFEAAVALKLSPAGSRFDGISIELTPFYTLSFEEDDRANYFGTRLGFTYKFAKKIRNTDKKVKPDSRSEETLKED